MTEKNRFVFFILRTILLFYLLFTTYWFNELTVSNVEFYLHVINLIILQQKVMYNKLFTERLKS